MLWFVGLGISGGESIPVEVVKVIQNADMVYLESFTSPIYKHNEEKIKSLTNGNFKIAKRWLVEDGQEILRTAKVSNVVLLSYGDPYIATTHIELRSRAKLEKFETKTIHSDNPNALEQIKSETANQGVDIVIVSTSNLNALKDAINFVRKGGTIVMFGVPTKGAKVELDMSEVYSKGLTIVNSYAASDFDTKEALEKISSKQINVSQLITHKYNLQECQQAFVHARTGDNAMKIIINN